MDRPWRHETSHSGGGGYFREKGVGFRVSVIWREGERETRVLYEKYSILQVAEGARQAAVGEEREARRFGLEANTGCPIWAADYDWRRRE